MVYSEISFVPSSQSGLCLLQLLVLEEECITEMGSLSYRINLCSSTIAGWYAWGGGKLFFCLCDLSGNLSGEKLEVVIGISTENVNRNLSAPVMMLQTQLPCLKHRTNCT